MARAKKKVAKQIEPTSIDAVVKHAVNMVAENFTGQLRVVAEGITELRESLDAKLDEKLEPVNLKLSVLEVAVRLNSADIQGLKVEMAGVKSELGGVKSDVDVLKHEMSGVKAELSGVKSELGGVKSDVDVLKHEMSGVKAELSGVKSELGGVKSELGGVKSELAQLTQRFDRHESRTEARLDALEKKVG